MTGADFIDYAARIVARPNANPSACRTAVSRAYYGSFHLARTFVENIGVTVPSSAHAHGLLPRMLHASGHSDAVRAGALLGDLHSDRLRADYRLNRPEVETVTFARLAVETAHEIRSALAACDSREARDAIKAAIEEHLRLTGSQ